VVIACLLLASGAPASGDEDTRVRAKAEFERGKTLYRLTRYTQALEAFTAAYLLAQEPALLFNIAQCQRELGQDEAALKTYRSYLASSSELDADRAEIERTVAGLEASIAARQRDEANARRQEQERTLALTRAPGLVPSPRRATAFLISGGALGALGVGLLAGGIAPAVQAGQARDRLRQDAAAGNAYDPALGRRYDGGVALSAAIFSVGGTLAVVGAGLLGRGVWERRASARSAQ
jgi:tetratricopeptide (TPR) repeat protein